MPLIILYLNCECYIGCFRHCCNNVFTSHFAKCFKPFNKKSNYVNGDSVIQFLR